MGLFINKNISDSNIVPFSAIQDYLAGADPESKNNIYEVYASQADYEMVQMFPSSRYEYVLTQGKYNYVMQITNTTGKPYAKSDYQDEEVGFGNNYEVPNREKRDSLLVKTDWTDSSSVLSFKCQQSMRSYRQLLRDLFEIVDVEQPVVFPSEPELEFNYSKVESTVYKADLEALFQIATVDKTCQAKWNLFLQEWHNLQSTTNIAVVNTLLDIYCPELKDSILKHLS
jgi:hypothetical protein